MADLLIILIVAAVILLTGLYVYKAKKNGQKCIGCPHSKTCGAKNCSCSQK